MAKLTVDKFASSTLRLGLTNPVEVSKECPSETGTVVIVRAMTENPAYPDIELVDGSFSKIRKGDIIAGVLGSRQALRGYVGYAPYKLAAGDTLNLLNLGGVIGRCIDGHRDLGEAVQVEFLGTVMKGRIPMNISQSALEPLPLLGKSKPIILVMGSCMNVGKTAVVSELIRLHTKAGLRVGAAKISGIACLRDTRKFEAAGAVKVFSFLDCGVPSTIDAEDVGAIARTLLGHLNRENIDIIVLELGDGIIGHYRVDGVLSDRSVMEAVSATVFCASDLVSAWGGRELLDRKGITIDVVSGPATDNVAGTSYIENALGLHAANALTDGPRLLELLQPKMTAAAGERA